MGDVTNGGMRSTGITGAERSELATVLASPTFARAQRLIKLLEYICEKHFEGQDAQLCEYAIATEVLGRPSNFDPAEDAIARVEIHRLRKKLREYYAAEGSRQPLKILIPPGMYTPVFQQEAGSATAPPTNGNTHTESVAATLEEPPDDPIIGTRALPPAVRVRRPAGKRWIWLFAIFIVLA